ncbi:MAG TPA: hypothetical protein VGC66_10570 [Pyrinomonadaceae bacterium]
MSETKPISTGALYYPYIHIDDVNWLRANLLIFPCIKRMVPSYFTPMDKPPVRELAKWSDDKEPLLQPANLFTKRVKHAQAKLSEDLKRSAKKKAFLERFGVAAARQLVGENDYGFQIHAGKLSRPLKEALAHTRLAWNPYNKEPYDMASEYVEVHPNVGEAVMSTLAIACAQDDGLDIVGDKRTGELHRCLLEKDLDSVYDAWLKLNAHMPPPQEASGEELLEVFLGISGDLSKLSTDALRDLNKEREPIDDLMTELRKEARKINTMSRGKNRDDQFKQVATQIMTKWEADRNNLSNFWRAFWGKDTADLATKFAGAVADKTLTGVATGVMAGAGAKATLTTTAAASAANAGWVGALAAGGVIGAGAGLIIGVIAHAGKTYHDQRKRAKNSPYRFLTTLESAGILCRF